MRMNDNYPFQQSEQPYATDYVPDQETSYVIHLDPNNLYGWAMAQPPPTGEWTG